MNAGAELVHVYTTAEEALVPIKCYSPDLMVSMPSSVRDLVSGHTKSKHRQRQDSSEVSFMTWPVDVCSEESMSSGWRSCPSHAYDLSLSLSLSLSHRPQHT